MISDIATTYYNCSTPIVEVISEKEKNLKSNQTNSIYGTVENLKFKDEDKNEKKLSDLKEKTLSSLVEYEEETIPNYGTFKNVEDKDSVSYTQNYLKHNFSIIITQLMELTEKWMNSDNVYDCTSEINQIKIILEENEVYLEETPESRLLLGGLETIFENDRWEKLDKERLEIVYKQLDQFKTGNIKMDYLKNFSREIYSSEIL